MNLINAEIPNGWLMEMDRFASYLYTHTPGALKEELPFTLESIGYKCVESDTNTYPLAEKIYYILFCIEGQCIAETTHHRYIIEKTAPFVFVRRKRIPWKSVRSRGVPIAIFIFIQVQRDISVKC